MCWETRYGMLSVQRTATKDIHVKKVFMNYHEDHPDEDLRSFFKRLFRWRLGIIYKARLDKSERFTGIRRNGQKCYTWKVYCGFHSAKEIEVKWNQDKESGYLIIGKARSVFYNPYTKWFLKNRVAIHECIIPKGSKYYVNEYGEYVSDQLIVLPNS